ncbi:MAG: hypothetical protein ACYS67_07125 [Planctomycetota bacterium]|jgi:hypothetical protein
MLKAFENKLRWIRIRCSFNLLLEQLGRVFAAAGVISILTVLAERLLALNVINSFTLRIFTALVIILALLFWLLYHPSRMQVALLLDERLKLKERFSTTLAMAESKDPFALAACREARQAAQHLRPKGYFPIKPTRFWLYAIGMWFIVAMLFRFMPQKDLLGFLKEKQERQEQARQVELAQKDIKQKTSAVKLAVKQLGDPELDAELAELAEMPKGAKPDVAKRQAIRKLGDIGDKLKKMQSSMKPESVEFMQQMFKQLRGSPNAFSQQLRLALAQGNFAQASNLMKQFQKQLLEGKLSEQQRKALSQQLQNLARQLQELARKNEQFEAELEKLGLNKKLAKLNEDQLRKALQIQGLSQKKIEQLLQKMAACRSASSRCSGIGKAMAACGAGAGGLSGDELAALADQLDELDTIRQQIMLSQATLDEIERAIGRLGQGMCQGPGRHGPFREGLANRFGPGTGGPGRGYGPRASDEDGQTSSKKTRIKNKTGQGPVVASWYIKGTQVKGQAKRDFSEVIQAGRDSASEAISENQIPRRYEESVMKYFGQLEESDNE